MPVHVSIPVTLKRRETCPFCHAKTAPPEKNVKAVEIECSEWVEGWRITGDHGLRVENADADGVLEILSAVMRTKSVTQIVVTRAGKPSTAAGELPAPATESMNRGA